MGSFRTSQRLVKENSENIHHNKEQKVTRKKRMSISTGLNQDEVKKFYNTKNAFNQWFLS